jgi:glycosyltransferase involved in cell wall biosynthesis
MQSTEQPYEILSSPVLTIIIPVYNARDKIAKTLENIQTDLDSVQASVFAIEGIGKASYRQRSESSWYEIIVVDDGSIDNTREVTEDIVLNDKRIRMVSYRANRGKGYAIKQGVIRSQGKYVIFMDGDGNIGNGLLSSYLQKLQDADMIIGSKYVPSSVVHAPLSRKLLSKCFHYIVRILLGIKVRDTQVGLKVGRGDAFRMIFKSVLVKRYAFDAEMLAIASLLGLRIVEMPVKIDLDKGFKMKDIARMALDVLGIAYRLHIKKWYQANLANEASLQIPN